jgi:hypothetical protein
MGCNAQMSISWVAPLSDEIAEDKYTKHHSVAKSHANGLL